MTMTLTANRTPRAPHLALRIGLVLLSAILTIGALDAYFPRAFDNGVVTALGSFAALVTAAKNPLTPLLAGAALLLASVGRVRYAIMALGAAMLLAWANELSSVASDGLKMGAIGIAEIFVYPVIALAAIGLALRDRLLGLALAFVALPTMVFWIMMGPFVIGVMIYGF